MVNFLDSIFKPNLFCKLRKLKQMLTLLQFDTFLSPGYAIVQCAGDTVFIPAGACHQVIYWLSLIHRSLENQINLSADLYDISPSKIDHFKPVYLSLLYIKTMFPNNVQKFIRVSSDLWLIYSRLSKWFQKLGFKQIQ
jgi:hypothetical protein